MHLDLNAAGQAAQNKTQKNTGDKAWKSFRASKRPGPCGGCYAKAHYPDLHDQLRHATSFAPDFKLHLRGLVIAQQREGEDGKAFPALKLRSMPIAPPSSPGLSLQGGTKPDVSHLSPFQRFLRGSDIDELPQIFNIFRGEMKLVGVRPVAVAEASVTPRRHRNLRATAKPGLIGVHYCEPDPGCRKKIMEIERRYLLRYRKAPLTTDAIYLAKFLIQKIKGRRSI